MNPNTENRQRIAVQAEAAKEAVSRSCAGEQLVPAAEKADWLDECFIAAEQQLDLIDLVVYSSASFIPQAAPATAPLLAARWPQQPAERRPTSQVRFDSRVGRLYGCECAAVAKCTA